MYAVPFLFGMIRVMSRRFHDEQMELRTVLTVVDLHLSNRLPCVVSLGFDVHES